MAIKNNLKEILEEKNKTLYWLAKESGISYPTLFKLSKNETDSIKFSILEKICITLNCKIEELLEINEE